MKPTLITLYEGGEIAIERIIRGEWATTANFYESKITPSSMRRLAAVCAKHHWHYRSRVEGRGYPPDPLIIHTWDLGDMSTGEQWLAEYLHLTAEENARVAK